MELNSSGFLKMSKTNGKRPVGRQSAPIVYQLNGLWVYDKEKFLKYKKPLLPKILPYEISPETGFMIDTEFEFKIAELIVRNKLLKI